MPLTHCDLHGYSKLAAKVSKKHMLNLYSFTSTSDPVAVAFFIFQCWFYTIFKVCKFKIIFIFTILSMVLCTRTTSILNLPRIMPLWLLGVRGKLWRGHCGGIFNLEWKKIVRQKQPPEVFYVKRFLETSQNSQENTCPRVSFLIKLQA